MNTIPPVYLESASTLAVIALSNEPLIYLSEELRVIASSASFCSTFDLTPAAVTGRLLSEIGEGEWDIHQVISLLNATASGLAAVEMYETSLVRPDQPPRQLIVNAHRMVDEEDGHVRLLVAISDVTVARAEAVEKENLIREKDILLREVQHRVANSLQIIASVLMQSARRVQSVEVRGHLRNAHNRVMSIATVQRFLATSTLDDVDIGVYLKQLCQSLAASMISESNRLSIVVSADATRLAANLSISLGLIVTELVINALMHAFSEAATGRMDVSFHSTAAGWILSVSDNGSGMPVGTAAATAGLGSSIIRALAQQLMADVSVSDNHPGTRVTITHSAESAGKPGPPAA
jgi:two-component sensor histidine kinase